MTNYEDFKKEQLKDPEVKKEYDLIQKQIEIRKGIANIQMGWVPDVTSHAVRPTKEAYQYADNILAFLHSQGVVIKVEREWPQPTTTEEAASKSTQAWLARAYEIIGMDVLLKAGYIAVESLIEEEK